MSSGESTDHGEVGTVGEYRLLTMLLGTVTGVAIAASSWKLKLGQIENNKWLIFVLVAGILGGPPVRLSGSASIAGRR